MNLQEFKKLAYLISAFAVFFILDFREPPRQKAVIEGLLMLQDYIREHTLMCLIPALFISGGIAAVVAQVSVIRFFTAGVNRFAAYGVASVSGTILAVCSCTVLPLFSGIYRRGAGLGPAVAFLYSGPAINVLALVMTARILGWQLGLARLSFSIIFSVLIGLLMQKLFHTAEPERVQAIQLPEVPNEKPMWKNLVFFATMVAILLIATMPQLNTGGFYDTIFGLRYWIAIGLIGLLAAGVFYLLTAAERPNWLIETWANTKLIVPWLFVGVFFAGVALGRPDEDGLVPKRYIAALVGGESLSANLVAAISGALMYFATLTEVPIVQGLSGSGMGNGPALALLLAGPALSLPSLLALTSIMGFKRTAAYFSLVVFFSTTAGWVYGNWMI
jgi:uncharacterized membrane protein YraQ (UPF0718 family)